MAAAAAKVQHGGAGTTSKLRYPLRAAAAPKDEKPAAATGGRHSAKSSITARSATTGADHLRHGREDDDVKAAKGTARTSLFVPSVLQSISSAKSPAAVLLGRRSAPAVLPSAPRVDVGKPDGPAAVNGRKLASDEPKPAARKRFDVLLSASYWLSQIKLSESASKHSISLGFFKLALETGCQPLGRLRGELKSYGRRHNILELGEPARELLTGYNILEELEQQLTEVRPPAAAAEVISADDDEELASAGAGHGPPRAGGVRKSPEPTGTPRSARRDPIPRRSSSGKSTASRSANLI